jgi:hypothetical protein
MQPITRSHHVLQLLLRRTSRQLLWLLACGLVGAGYALLWQVPGRSYVPVRPTTPMNGWRR